MEDMFDELMKRVANTAKQVTPIIFKQNPPGADPVGCGIYLRINDARYLISAGHLLNLEDWENLIVPAGGDKMVYLNGELNTTYQKFNNMCEFDFAVHKFSERQNKHFADNLFPFCTPEKIIVNHKVDPNGYYVISGYPVTGVKKVCGKSEYSPLPLKFITAAMSEDTYKRHHINPQHFILVKYQRKVAPAGSANKVITKEATGISGSGLWYIPNWKDLKNEIPKFYLVGIMIENHKDKRFMKALRIDFVTQLIKEKYIQSAFEETNLLTIDTVNLHVAYIP